MADMCIDYALGKRKQTKVTYQWNSLLTATSKPKARSSKTSEE